MTKKTDIRVEKTINRDWKFNYYPSEEEDLSPIAAEFDDRTWSAVAVPHTWSTYETTGEMHPFIRNPSEKDNAFWWYGWGWYRKKIILDDRYRSKKVFIEFDGIQKYSKVWLNGQFIGDHKGGFTSFYCDVTDALRFGEENVLAIEVSNRRNDLFGGIPPMTAGNWNTYGGIYRDVRIIIKDKLHIPFQGSALHEGGTFITTPDLSSDEGKVRVRTYVKNEYEQEVVCQLLTQIWGPDGEFVAEMTVERRLASGELAEFDQTCGCVEQPQLWSPDTPILYQICSELKIYGRITDRYVSTFGFRWFEWNYEEKQLYLNGQRIHIHGSNRHQEYPWLGDAQPKWMHEKDLRDIHYNLGFNFMRTCHYNQDPCIYDLCDEYGLLICEEVPNIKNIAFGEDIQEQHVREMIRRDRNHPSIIMWSMGNETNHAADPRWAYSEDDTRIIHCRHCAGMGEDLPHTHHQMPMEHLLRCTIRGWYNEDVKPLEPSNHQHTGHEEWQHNQSLTKNGERLVAVQGAKWLYADHGCDREYLNSPLKHINPKGWVDSYRMPKYLYYLWQANWSKQTMVFIHPYDWTSRYLGYRRSITVNSNCEEVTLSVNGKVISSQKPTETNDFTVVFTDVLIEQGTIIAQGTHNGIIVKDAVVMAGPPAKLVVTASHPQFEADRSGIVLMTIDIVDEQGVHVYGASNDLHFTLSGPAKLVGPDSYTSDIDKCNEMEGTMYIDVPVAIPVRSTEATGKVRFTVSSPGLQSASVEIEAVAAADDFVEGLTEPPVKGGLLRIRANDQAADAGVSNQVDELENSVDDIDFRGVNESLYAEKVSKWIWNRNLHINVGTPAFAALVELMAAQLKKDRGLTVADDYNFNIEQFNDCCRILAFINQQKWNEQIKQKLRHDYIDAMITQGVAMDVASEINRLSNI
ncbi:MULTISPECIES: glycoside hydrolase family 2 TIM barrel-domain containing protein [unclassified Paenibacillus]|uniref:glycoside hydrolase family 2 TIM barrel-domain containing protein n=1 Tax=unclassified Paenibacillus TaxID=185978 RepID=UPI00363DCE6B